jgi:flagellar hook protein FlgE
MAVGSFSAGLSGLNANSVALNVIGNNLANINTVGFKQSQVTFSDLVSQSVGGNSVNPMQLGLGVATGSISPVFGQGAIENTSSPFDVALQGNGLFVVRGSDGQVYSRAGNFKLDSNGTLITSDGLAVQGYVADATGVISASGQLSDISIPPGTLRAPTPTRQYSTVTNLDAGAAQGTTFTTSVQIFDAVGSAHISTITYTKSATAGAWNYSIAAPGDEVVGGTAGTPYTITSGTLSFDGAGVLTQVDGGAPADVTLTTPAWTNGASANNLVWDLVDANGESGLTSYSGSSATSSINQDGSSAGQVTVINIDSDGVIKASFGAGQTISLAQLAVANFNNPEGLLKLGSNLYSATQSAGIPNIGAAGSGGRGTVIGNALEQSNVDIAREFTQMILAQRGYQANAKSITTADQILVDTVNLKS